MYEKQNSINKQNKYETSEPQTFVKIGNVTNYVY